MKFLCSVFVPTILMPQHNKRWQRLRYIHIYRLRKKVLVDEGVISDFLNNWYIYRVFQKVTTRRKLDNILHR